MKKRMLYFIMLSIMSSIILNAQQCHWYSYGGAGHVDDQNGFTIGQTIIAHSSHDGDSLSYGFWLLPWEPILCVSIDDSIWLVDDEYHSDTIDIGEIINMQAGDEIRIINCGNCLIDLGLYWDDSDTLSIELSYLPSTDRAVVRAQFREDSIRAVSYDASTDYIKPTITWANSELFGPDGNEFRSSEDINLWFQFLSPSLLETVSAGLNVVPIILTTKISLP